MEQTPPPQTQDPETLKSFDDFADDALEIANTPTERQQFEDDLFFKQAANASRGTLHADPRPNQPPFEVPERDEQKGRSSLVKGVATAAVATAAFAGAVTVGVDKGADIFIENQEQRQEADRNYSEQMEQANRDFENGTITLNVPASGEQAPAVESPEEEK